VIGTTLDGKYRIDRLVGAGAMGAVYEGEHTGTGRRVAIKVISSGDVSHDKKLVARFQREAKAAGAIDTQHITQVLDAGEDDSGSPYLVMELLHGEDLQSAIKRLGPLPPELALRIVAQTCLGLAKAHEAGVVHRDIKPANLFLARRDAGELLVKLLDFGIAKVKMDHAADTENMALTKTGSMLGSPLYMSPEQAKGLKTIDHRADLWSLGIVLYQALTGKTPYDHCDALGGLIIAICHEDVTPVQELAPWVAPEIATIVHRALQRDPAARYQSAMEMFEALKPLLPHGYSVNQEMLMPLSDTQKAAAVRRLSVPPGARSLPPGPRSMPPGPRSVPPPGPRSVPPPGSGVASSRSMPPPGGGLSLPPPPGVPTGLAPQSTTAASALAQSDSGAPTVRPTTPSRAPVLIAGGAAAVVLGLLAFFFMQSPPQQLPRPAVTSPTAPTAPPAPTPVVNATARASAKVVAPPPTPKRVKVVILPSTASADVDGEKASVKDGLVEITGLPRSVHRVRVYKGKQEVTVDVTITQDGPDPAKIDLNAK
jgi:eukaryotic-like serine/threonine-protein kinase